MEMYFCFKMLSIALIEVESVQKCRSGHKFAHCGLVQHLLGLAEGEEQGSCVWCHSRGIYSIVDSRTENVLYLTDPL